MNAPLVSFLRAQAELSAMLGRDWSSLAYRRAADKIATQQELCGTATKIPGVGKTIGKYVADYCAGRPLPEVPDVTQLSRVMGAGPATLHEWISLGYTKVSDIPLDGLTHIQRIGVVYYDDINSRIPRYEVTEIVNAVTAAAKRLGISPEAITPAGSYRRMLPTSGDVDILVTLPKSRIADIANELAATRDLVHLYGGESRVSFLLKIRDKYRVVDLQYIKPSEHWAALLYFTGSAEHVRGLRALAKKKGWRLNQTGLYTPARIRIKSEQHLYELLGVPYVDPEHR